jgi:hypothetical protein
MQEPYKNEILEAVLDVLPLLHNKGILFIELLKWKNVSQSQRYAPLIKMVQYIYLLL